MKRIEKTHTRQNKDKDKKERKDQRTKRRQRPKAKTKTKIKTNYKKLYSEGRAPKVNLHSYWIPTFVPSVRKQLIRQL
jgi:hypothetical protein